MTLSLPGSSRITSCTAHYIFGKIASNPNALRELDSMDIVKSLFSVQSTNPTAMDIVGALINNMTPEQSNKIRKRLIDRGCSGNIWRFLTHKGFRIDLCKIPTFEGKHDLLLTLVSITDKSDGAIFSRALVKFNSEKIEVYPAGQVVETYEPKDSLAFEELIRLRDEQIEKCNRIKSECVIKEETPTPPVEEQPEEVPSVASEEVQEPIPESTVTEPEPFVLDVPILPESPKVNDDDDSQIVISLGDVVTIEKVKDAENTIRISNGVFETCVVDPNIDNNFTSGKYFANTCITKGFFKTYEQLSELFDVFDVLENSPTPEEPPKQSEETPKESNMHEIEPRKYNLVFDENATGLVDCKESIEEAFFNIIENDPSASDEVLTKKLREFTEIDNIVVKLTDDLSLTFTISEDKQLEGCVTQPINAEQPTDLNVSNPELQAKLLRGMFGVVDPAITHLQKFLKNHLTAENDSLFLATGTFPTETTVVYTEKPYNVTISIVKFKDGRFYRMFLAETNVGLSEHGYVATKDIPNRWVRLGRDVQNMEYRSDYRGRRF